MRYQALLFCPDDKTARVVTQVLSELEFQVECCNEPFAAVKKLMAQHFDAIVVDCENEQNASLLFKSARNSGSNASALSVAVVEGQAGVAKAFRIGANLVLTRPINVEQSKGTLRVARGLLRKAGAAAAPARAKEVADPEIVPFESKPIWPARPEADFEINSTSGRSRTEAPVFSSLSGIEAQQESGSGGATRKFVFVLLAAGLVIGGYFGWSKMHAGSHPAVVQEPSAVVRPAPSVMPPAPLPPEEQSASTPPKQVEVSESPAQQPEEVSVDPNPKPARAKPTPAIINTAPASKEPVPAKPQPIVVKNDFSRQTKWEAALPPAPAPLSIASAPNDQALTSIVAAPVHVPNPVRETLKVSQGVSQGLLVKRVQPVYPPQARQMHLEGTVQLLASIRN